MPLQATSGVATYDAFGGGAATAANYIEDVFSTWLYTGNGSTQTITNGIDLAGEGGMVWGKTRDAVVAHTITDTVRGVDKEIFTNTTDAQVTRAAGTGSVYAFNSNGFSTSGVNGFINYSGLLEVAWTFREQPKFFDVVTWVGNGTNQTVNHSLGSLPGCIIYKRTDSTSDWFVSTRNSAGNYEFLKLNTTAASVAAVNPASIDVTTTSFDPLRLWGNVNGASYVAYLFAHDAGGFGLTGTDNVISCGSFTMDGSGNPASVTLGYEPQMVIVKRTDSTSNWFIEDNMRGMPVTGNGAQLYANTSGAEAAQNIAYPNATGFTWNIGIPSATYIYIAIRRGPMRTPTTGTSVFKLSRTANTFTYPIIQNQNSPLDSVDLLLTKKTNEVKQNWWANRLTGFSQFIGGEPGGSDGNLKATPALDSTSQSAETSTSVISLFLFGTANGAIYASVTDPYSVLYGFKRAPGFFDVVCYTGTGSARTVSHNLGVVPEMIIVKTRSGTTAWFVYQKDLGNTHGIRINSTIAAYPDTTLWNNTTPTSSVFTLGSGQSNTSAGTYVAYLFASVPGVSKVGSYTGTGTTQTINCGFTAGSRFVMIKRTDSTGDWYVWDSARGIVAGNDPYLLLNSTAAEVTSTDYVDTAATGFEISSTAPAAINASGGTFIFLAIA